MEILFRYSGAPLPKNNAADIRWLGIDDYHVFLHHLELCGQRPISENAWKEVYDSGTIYCGLFENGEMIARACKETISNSQWEIADVRVVPAYRNQGRAFRICDFVLAYILSMSKTPTIRAEEDNYAMLKVIERLGFVSK